MANIVVPTGEPLRRAIRWLSEQRQDRPEAKLAVLVNEAALRYDLSPAEQQALLDTFAPATKSD